jgi:molybdate transport system substrate-binding protein
MRRTRQGFIFSVIFVILTAWMTFAADGYAQSPPQPLTIAAAADLQSVFPTLAAQFEKETGHHVTLTFGSSGNFFAQMQNGAPFDLFFSADIDYPKRLEAASLAEPSSLYEYATGRIVLWTRKDSGIDLGAGLNVLRDPKVRRIAIANPEHAPYGRAAVAALRHAGLYEAVQSKIVLGENISQAAQFVQSGNAEVGIIALSLTLSSSSKDAGTSAEIPADSYPAIQQAAVILKTSRNKPVARQFLAFLARPDVVKTMKAFGFGMPDAPTISK